ncbi:hypothetical protein ACJMK2_025626 [Sinanodonta woodiana]|uniref:G-protein coupled receptors family 1 profile domain-containing protein n=1 Tax=Sinanodonta woodiana TaxID=1069815 RepID=A0ABD3XGP0_SINWO
MKSEALRHKSYSHYISALAVFDSLTLIGRQVSTVNEYYITQLKEPGLFSGFSYTLCKLYNFIEHTCYLMSSWLIVLMAVERVFAVCLPFKQCIIRKECGAIIAICALCLIVSLTQAFRFVMIGSINGACEAEDEFLILFTALEIYFYQVTLTFVIPAGIVLVCNSLVIHQIFHVIRKASHYNESRSTRYARVVNKRHKTSVMLLIVSFSFILTLLPLFILTIIIDISVKTKGSGAYQLYRKMLPFHELCVVISLLNYGVNFFIYILWGRSFRFELRKIFKRERTSSNIATRTKEEIIKL